MAEAQRVALIGVGNMGGAVLSGLVASGYDPSSITVGVRRADQAAELSEQLGVVTTLDLTEAVEDADVVILGVKPYQIADLLDSLHDSLQPGQVVVSLAAGLTTATMESHVPDGVEVVRAMPNTPSLLREGVTLIAAGATATDDSLDRAESVLSAVGLVARIPEKDIDAGTALSGSGPAYVYLVAEALIEAGVHLGLTRDVATQLTNQTLVGASLMLRETGEHAAILRERVTSPGGTTAAALRVLEEQGLRAAFLEATRANVERSREIAQGK